MRFSSGKTANSRVFCRHTLYIHTYIHTYIHIYRRTQTLNPSLRIGAPGNKSLRDEDGYYVNDDLFPEEYRMGNTPEKTTVKKAKEGVDDMLSDEANSTLQIQ